MDRKYKWRIAANAKYYYLDTVYLNVVKDNKWILDHNHSATLLSEKELKALNLPDIFEKSHWSKDSTK